MLYRSARDRDHRLANDVVRNRKVDVISPEHEHATVKRLRMPSCFADQDQEADRIRRPVASLKWPNQTPANAGLEVPVRCGGAEGVCALADLSGRPTVLHYVPAKWKP